MNQIVRHGSKSVIFAPRRAMLERDILAHDIASFAQALLERIN
jgi:hypothetical protein